MHDTSKTRGYAAKDSTKRRPHRLGWRFVLSVALVALLMTALIRAFFVEIYYIPSGSMEPTLQEHDRVLVNRSDRSAGELRRGDLVVFDGRGSFAPLHDGDSPPLQLLQNAAQWLGLRGSDTVYVKRVLGLPGDRVSCCGVDGRVAVNGQPLEEDYVYQHDAPSEVEFDVSVPEGRLWLMGDHRSISADSRSLLGAPGGGFVSIDRVIGRPTTIIWPLDRFGPVEDAMTDADTAAHLSKDAFHAG